MNLIISVLLILSPLLPFCTFPISCHVCPFALLPPSLPSEHPVSVVQATKLDRRTQEERNANFLKGKHDVIVLVSIAVINTITKNAWGEKCLFQFTILRSSYMTEGSQGRDLERGYQSNPEQQQLKFWKTCNSRLQNIL